LTVSRKVARIDNLHECRQRLPQTELSGSPGKPRVVRVPGLPWCGALVWLRNCLKRWPDSSNNAADLAVLSRMELLRSKGIIGNCCLVSWPSRASRLNWRAGEFLLRFNVAAIFSPVGDFSIESAGQSLLHRIPPRPSESSQCYFPCLHHGQLIINNP